MQNHSFRRNSGFGHRNHRFNSRRRTKGQDVDISAFIKQSGQTTQIVHQVEDVSIQSFSEFKLDPQVQHAIVNRGYQVPTPIQGKTIAHILEGKDLLGLANTGTGKTGAFLIPLINKVLADPHEKVLIMAPTRELAIQIAQEFKALAKALGIYAVLCIGGTSLFRQRQDLSRPYNFIISTPGRLLDVANQKLITLAEFRNVVLDEVDRMLDMGFIHDMRKILGALPQPRQSLFFSATTTKEVLQLIQEFSQNLTTVSVKTQESAASIDQGIIKVTDQAQKLEMLHDLLKQQEFEKVLIFGRTKYGVQKLSKKLSQRGFLADAIHGNKSQSQRQQVLLKFRQNRINILVATDVAARGLDIPDITHVINFDAPATYEDYIHRIGRTGRAEQKGKALTFVS